MFDGENAGSAIRFSLCTGVDVSAVWFRRDTKPWRSQVNASGAPGTGL